jgi:hypothetical protein
MPIRKLHIAGSLLVAVIASFACASAATSASKVQTPAGKWESLFDGKTLKGWTTKIVGYPAGQDPLETFRVKNGAIVINYDKYGGDMKARWAHLFYNEPFKAYRLALEYRFVGEEMLPLRRTQFNSGLLYYSQSPQSMGLDQPYPISIEAQILGYFPVLYRDGGPRMTVSACGLGTSLSYLGTVTQDCFKSTEPTRPNEQWVLFELEVLPSGLVHHYIDGKLAATYDRAFLDTYDKRFPSQKFIDAQGGNPTLTSGYIALQSEGHSVEFRNIRVMKLD